jgi:two-component system chemotaxis sensor kinase CheA
MNENEEFVQEFLVECDENLDQVDQDLIALERDPRNTERLASIFRSIHTIKGTSGFFGFSKLGAIAHVGENLLSRLRDGELLLDEETTTALLDMVDAIREIAGNIEQGGDEGTGDYRELTDRITALSHRPGVAKSAEQAVDTARAATEEVTSPAADEELQTETDLPEAVPAAEEGPSDDGQLAGEPGEPEPASAAEPASEPYTPERPEAMPTGETRAATPSEGSIRVDVGLLDKLMNLVGELVLTRNQIRPFGESTPDRTLASASQQLDLITSELQEGVMQTRMQPIRNILAKFPRVVRDLAVSNDKQVQLTMQGQDTELDRTLIESIKDPLTHLVRNAVDHGIESPQERIARGKPACGQVVLRAFHEGGLVNIELSDDGAGIDPERIREKALQRELISRDEAREMSDRQLIQLIFLPGLSTADQVTEVSGRGVGMDVVKTNVEKIGGTMDIESRIGHGTLLRIKIPLTLAIIPALMVDSGGEQFAVPQVSLREILTLTDRSRRKIDHIQGVPFYRLRGELLPLVELNGVLGLEGRRLDDADQSVNILVLQAEGMRFGLVVDAVLNAEEIVVKPLHKALSRLPVFSGATILGNGRISLILDIVGLGQHAQLSTAGQAIISEPEPETEPANQYGEYLVCVLEDDRRIAMPVMEIERLEEVRTDEVELAGDQPVIQYRGQVMPLLLVGESELSALGAEGLLRIVVYRRGQKHLGLAVKRILDVWPGEQSLDDARRRPGIRGCTVIRDRVTDVIDTDHLARLAGVASSSTSSGETAT